MSAEPHYIQCTFKKVGSGLMETAWLPEKLAVVGKTIFFGKKSDGPRELWEVTQASDHRVPESYLRNHERDYKDQRKASDI